jgi:metal-sulfur cluster biosynthetic enzyme
VDGVEVDVAWDPAWSPERMSESAREAETPVGEARTLRETRLKGEDK